MKTAATGDSSGEHESEQVSTEDGEESPTTAAKPTTKKLKPTPAAEETDTTGDEAASAGLHRVRSERRQRIIAARTAHVKKHPASDSPSRRPPSKIPIKTQPKVPIKTPPKAASKGKPKIQPSRSTQSKYEQALTTLGRKSGFEKRNAATLTEVAKCYKLLHALTSALDLARSGLARIDKLLDQMPPLQRECPAVDQIEKVTHTQQEKLTKIQKEAIGVMDLLHRRLVDMGALKDTIAVDTTNITRPPGNGCALCRQQLAAGENYARCSRCNLLFHVKCISPLIRCAKCQTNISDFRGVF